MSVQTKTPYPSAIDIARLKLRGVTYPLERIYLTRIGAHALLDIGCGYGFMLDKFSADFDVVGIDVNFESLRIGKQQRPNLRMLQGDAMRLPFRSGSFDAVHCDHVIEHLTIEQAHGMLLEVVRVLRPGGALLLGTELTTDHFWDTFSHVRPYPPSAIKKLLQAKHQENFATLDALQIERVFYKGKYSKHAPLLWFYRVLSKLGFFRRDYVMILTKRASAANDLPTYARN